MSLKTLSATLSAAVATGGTFTVGYPAGAPGFSSRGPWALGVAPKITTSLGQALNSPNDFTVSYGATTATVTYNGATTLPIGTTVYMQFDAPGVDFDKFFRLPPLDNVLPMVAVRVELGSPALAVTNNIAAAQAVAGAGNLTLAAAVLTNPPTVPDVPRSWQIVSTNAGDTTQTVTVTGTDVYGAAMTELKTLNGTSIVLGLKAFFKITKVAISAACAGNVSMGTSTVLGLPVYLPNAALIMKELIDGAAATAGTTVAGLSPNTKSTNATADVRGTYISNSANDGTKQFELVCLLSDPAHKGNPQA